MKTPPTPTKPETVRLTIPVTAEVHETFQRLAKAGNMSTGRAMGEWLLDTIDAATFMAQTIEKARSAPAMVARELHAYALGLGDETNQLIAEIQKKGRADRLGAGVASASPEPGRSKSPRLVIRGGNSPQNTAKKQK
jgi:hypothetical protein